MTIYDAPGSPLTPSGLASLSSAAHIIGLPHQGSDASPLRGKRAHDMRRPAPILSERLPSGQRRSRHPCFTHPAICARRAISSPDGRPLVTSESPCVTRSAPDMRTWLGDRFAAAPQAWSESARRPRSPARDTAQPKLRSGRAHAPRLLAAPRHGVWVADPLVRERRATPSSSRRAGRAPVPHGPAARP